MTSVKDLEPAFEYKEKPNQEDEKNVGGDVVKSLTERLKFFFSDANIRQDHFIRKFLMVHYDNKNEKEDISFDMEKKEDETEDKDSSSCDAVMGGSIPVEVLLRFNTIKQHTTDPDMIVKVVKTQMSGTLQMNHNNREVARIKPFTDKFLNGNIPLSLYVRNIPAKEIELEPSRKKVKQYDVSMDEIRELFEPYGKVALVKLRYKVSARSRDDDHTDDIKAQDPDHSPSKKAPRRKYPIGACLVEFETNESLEKAAADVLTKKDGETVEPKRKLELKGESLEVELLKDHVDAMQSRKRDREDKGDYDNSNGKHRATGDGTNGFTIDWKPGCVLSLRGLPESCDREAIVDAALEACEMDKSGQERKCVYADFSRGQKDGAVRLENPHHAFKMAEMLKSGAVMIGGSKIEEAKLLEGKEEKDYWENFIEFKKRQIFHRNEERSMKHRNKKRRGRGC